MYMTHIMLVVGNYFYLLSVTVALNYQTTGKAMDYNIGKFQQNGGCGYILKPSWMLEGTFIWKKYG